MRRAPHTTTRTKLLRKVFLCVLCFPCFLCVQLSTAQPDSKRVTFYTAQTSYPLPVSDRNNTEYVGLFEALEPMGAVTARVDGSKWKLKFRNIDAQFESPKPKAKVAGKTVELPFPFILENSRGFVPLSSLKILLPLFGVSPIDYHESSRRLFAGAPVVRFTANKADAGKIAFSFSAPVNPFIATESGKLRMVFDREPLQSDSAPLSFDDKLITSATFSEANGSADVTVIGATPLTASFSDDRKTITISAVPTQQTPEVSGAGLYGGPPSAKQQTSGAAQASPPAKSHPFVIIDAAHGGSDHGAALGSKLTEKDVTLALAHRLRHDLEVHGISSILLREGDATLAPDQRAEIANASNAAFYLALHASSAGSGVRIYSSLLTPSARRPLAFVPVQAVQAQHVSQSRAAAMAMATDLLKHDRSATSLPASIAPLDSIAIPAVVIEAGPPQTGSEEFSSPTLQQSIANSIAAAIVAARSQLPHEVSQ